MTDQTGGQPPAGWYPDGSGQVRYWDGASWTEHVQPAQPEAVAPPQPAAPAEPAVPAAPAAAAAPVAAASAAGGQDTGYPADAHADQPFYRKPAGIAVIAAVLLLVLGGAVFALAGGGDDDADAVASPGGVATSAAPSAAPTTATQTYTLNCEPVSKIEGSNSPYPFALTLTATPTEITVSSNASINNTGPTTIEVDKYRFEASVTVNGTPLQLVGPTNKATAAGETGGKQPIFKAAELPLIATAATPATAGATPTVVLTDLYFNNINNDPTGTEKITDVFDSRCNASAQPNTTPTPIGLSVPPGAASSPAASVATP